MVRKKNLMGIFPLIMIVSMTLAETAFSTEVTTIFVEPPLIVDPTLVAGATFTVDIKITDVIDLYGFDLKLKYNASVLTATSITLTGNIFEDGSGMPDYTVWACQINDEIGRVWIGLAQELGAIYGVSGSGLLGRVTFVVDAIGDSYLDLYDTELRDSLAFLIPHVAYDGYFRNAENIYVADLVRKSAWPEHHHHVISKHGNINHLYARFGNKGPRAVTVRVSFTMYNATGGLLGTISTETYTLAVGEIPADLIAEFNITDEQWKYTSPGTKYKVKAELFYLDFELGEWFEGSKDKWFSFAVVD